MNGSGNYDSGNRVTMVPSLRISNSQYQRELIYNKLLPDAEDIEAESQVFLSEIKANLGRAVILREIEPGCEFWVTRLSKYIKIYGFMFSKEDHIVLIKLLYELVTIPELEPCSINVFSVVLNQLLKKKELLSPDDLQLPWKPLYNVVYRFKLCNQSYQQILRYPVATLFSNLRKLVRTVKVYFPISATKEILDELRPLLYPFTRMMADAFEILEWFLPVQLPPQYHKDGYQLWFDEFMAYWELYYNAPTWENTLMWLMARLASNNIGYIDWEPHLPLMFTRFIRYLNLPISNTKGHQSKLIKVDALPIAMWIVSVLGHDSNAQMYLHKFLKTIETFFHPANVGCWQQRLIRLFTNLSHEFILRVHKERYAKKTWETLVPDSHKLNDWDIDLFVKSMMPVAMIAMFSKPMDTETPHGLQYLATIRPSLVIPEVLERMYSTLDSLTEPHKLRAAIFCVTAIARPMVQGSRNINKEYEYPDGPTHVLPLLFALLPGIDPNDIRKCVATFRLIGVYAGLIPFVDSSKSTVPMTDEEKVICETTSRFEDFVLQFLDRIFVLIDFRSLEIISLRDHAHDRSRYGDFKSSFEALIKSILMQTSDQIFESALHKLRSHITERTFESNGAAQLAAGVCRVFASLNGQDTLRILLPVLSTMILDMSEEVDEISEEEGLDNRLLHSLFLLSAIVNTAGDSLLPHLDTLTEVLDRVLLLKSRKGVACKLLETILVSLTTSNAYKFKYAERDFNDTDYPFVRDWGQAPKIESLRIQWYIPGEREVAAAQNIFLKYFMPEVEKIRKNSDNWGTLSRKELLQCLNIVNSNIRGCENILPMWEEPPLKVVESSAKLSLVLPKLTSKVGISMPDGSNIKLYLVQVISDLQDAILKNAEDDTRSLFVLVEIWISLLRQKRPKFESLEIVRRYLRESKQLLKDELLGRKTHMGVSILSRVRVQHESRAEMQCFALTETHKKIILALLELATSRYSDVRSKARQGLFVALHYFPHSYTLIIPTLLEVMGRNTEEHREAYEGVLYILNGVPDSPIATVRNWEVLRSLWPAIIRCTPSEKPLIIWLRENLTDYIRKNFYTITIKSEVPESCLEAASNLWETSPQPRLPHPEPSEIQQGLLNLKMLEESHIKLYNELLNDLQHALSEENLHWRHRQMAMNFIRFLAHPQIVYPPKVLRYFLETLVNDTLEERKIAINTVTLMLSQLKHKHTKMTIDVPSVPEDTDMKINKSYKIIPGLRPDNVWLQYDFDSRPLNEKEWNEFRFIHKAHIGYYVWPKKLMVAAPPSQQPSLDPNVRELTEHEKEVDDFFNDLQNIEKLMKFFSLEEQKDKDRFNYWRYALFKKLFTNHGIVYLKHFTPYLYKFVKDKQESSQRCAAEILAGLINGAKHWPYEMVEDMWNTTLPIIRLALSNLTVETVPDWGICFSKALRHRDPNRYHWLLECLMEEARSDLSNSSLLECGRLYILQGALHQQIWRVDELMQRLLLRLENRLLSDPFEIVRDRLSSVLVTIFDANLRHQDAEHDRFTPRIQKFINKIIPRLQDLMNVTEDKCHEEEHSSFESTQTATTKCDNSEEYSRIHGVKSREKSIHLLQAICKWIKTTIFHSLHGTHSAFYQIFPILCLLENSDPDEEVSKTCSTTLVMLAQAFTLSRDMPTVLDAITQVSRSSSWGQRSTCLKFLQVLIFHNMSTLLSNTSWVKCVTGIVLRLLEDEQLEVRENAGIVLSGLLHCTFIPEQEKLLETFKAKAETKLDRKYQTNQSKTEVGSHYAVDSICIRHAGVLGLCAFIQAHPYDIPEYVPFIFECLDRHKNDPQPISLTIRKTLANFKRTHYDGWTGINGHARHFSEEQLEILQDLIVPPSHYA